MSRLPALTVACGLLLAAAPAAAYDAAEARALAERKACFGCHEIDKTAAAPSFKSIAARYQGVPDAVNKVAATLKTGGKSHFGDKGAMPAQVRLTAQEAQTLAEWALSQ
jgi:cytochrome c